MERYLITTADERTWKFDRPVVFLGEWCRKYNRKYLWQDMDAVIAPPYGLSQEKKNADHIEARALEEKLFLILYRALNRHHGVQHSARFWRIVLGHWLQRYVDVMLNRVRTLEHCLQTYHISGTTTFLDDNYALAPLDSYDAILMFNDDRWNNELYVRILNLLDVTINLEKVIDGEESNSLWLPIIIHKKSIKKRILKWGYLQLVKIAKFFARKNDALIINTYLPKKQQIKLNLALKQVPQIWTSPKLTLQKKSDHMLRKSLADNITNKSSDRLYQIMLSMIFELLPVSALEGFKELSEITQHLNWPKNPKFIFTSNNFDTDEIFKIWTAHRIELGVPYYVGQHGNYGVSRNHIDPSIEEITADKFITWGWTDGLPQHAPAFIFKTAGKRSKHYNPKGSLLLIESCLNHRITTWDGHIEFENYFENQKKFISELDCTQKQNLIIRLHASYRYMKFDEEARWQSFDQSLKIDKGNKPIGELVSQSRLVVHSYDSTGILETLSQNIPTLAFWQNDFDHLRESAKPYYQLLVDAGIVHVTAESVAQKVNMVWDDVDAWWGQNKVQEARKKFCDRYARVSKSPVSELLKIIRIAA
jgi:putative transferase (TIGR04331 family)